MTDALLNIASICGLLILSQLSPGPDVFFVFRTALSQGFRAGCAVAAGITAGFFIQTLLVCAAGTWVMEQEWSGAVLVAASCWLLYLAWKIFPRQWKAGSDSLSDQVVKREPLLRLMGQGFLCNILNPKCTLFICGLSLGSLRTYGAAFSWYTPVLVIGLQVASLAGWMLWSGLLQWPPLRRFYVKRVCFIDTIFALLLALFAILLLMP